MIEDPTPVRPAASRTDIAFNVGLTAGEIGLSILVFQLARSAGWGETAAYLFSAGVPVAGAIVYFARYRMPSVASGIILGISLFSAVVTLILSLDPKWLLYKGAGITGLVGLIFLASMMFGKPLAFYFGQRFAGASTPEGRSWWYSLWQYPGFRRSQRQITLVWAIVFILEAGLKIGVVLVASFDQAFIVGQILPFFAVGVAMWFTIRISTSAQRQAEAQ